jgi:hypothetical protein
MRNIIIKSYYTFLFAIFSLTLNQPVLGQEQENINIAGGLGVPELLSIGTRFQLEQVQIGFSIGALIIKEESMFSFSSDVYYHFAGFSKWSNRRPWYGRIGLNYFWDDTKINLHEFVYLNTRIGREFNISKKTGIGIDGGLLFELYHKKHEKELTTPWIDFDFPIIPSIGITVFYRIY